jgi:hypothetical protein
VRETAACSYRNVPILRELLDPFKAALKTAAATSRRSSMPPRAQCDRETRWRACHPGRHAQGSRRAAVSCSSCSTFSNPGTGPPRDLGDPERERLRMVLLRDAVLGDLAVEADQPASRPSPPAEPEEASRTGAGRGRECLSRFQQRATHVADRAGRPKFAHRVSTSLARLSWRRWDELHWLAEDATAQLRLAGMTRKLLLVTTLASLAVGMAGETLSSDPEWLLSAKGTDVAMEELVVSTERPEGRK